MAIVWTMLKDDKLVDKDKKATLLDFDKVLGLNLAKVKKEKIPTQITKLVKEREEAREKKDFKKSDGLRAEIEKLGYMVEDTTSGAVVKKK